MHEYKQHPPPGIVSPSSSETASFYHDHRLPLSHRFSLPLPVLCVTTQEGVWLFSGSYQSSRLVCGAKLRLIFLSCWNTQELSQDIPPPSATRWEAQSHLSLKFSMRSVPASSRLTSCHLPPSSTMHLYSNLLVPWRHHDSSCLKTLAHALSSAPKVLSQPLHSSAPKQHFLRGVIPDPRLELGVIRFS